MLIMIMIMRSYVVDCSTPTWLFSSCHMLTCVSVWAHISLHVRNFTTAFTKHVFYVLLFIVLFRAMTLKLNLV